MKDDQLELAKALTSSEEDLEAIIGFTCSPTLYGSSPSKDKLIESGKAWLKENNDKLKDMICKNKTIQNAVEKEHDLATLGLTILDALSQQSISFPVIPVIAYLLKKGISNFCDDTWRNL